MTANSANGGAVRVGAMRRLNYRSIWAVCSTTGLLLVGCAGQPPTDAASIRLFNRHRPQFEQLVRMAQKDQSFERIAPDFVRPTADTSSDNVPRIPSARLANYRALFRQVGAVDGIEIGSRSVTFEVYNEGMTGAGSAKSIVWSSEAPSLLVMDLDAAAKTMATPGSVWREIAPNWYLEYDAD